MKELNRILKTKGLSREEVANIKQRRRTLKNRNYASSCREKKDEEILTLEKQKGSEVEEITRMEEENEMIQKDIEQMKRKYRLLEQFAKDQNLEVIQ